MKLHAFKVRNFRRLKDTVVDVESDISIFVGANNSGKTSATQALEMFIAGSKEKFSIHDFSSENWGVINSIGQTGLSEGGAELPCISLDLWFEITSSDLHKVLDLLPSLDWTGTRVGLRICLQPRIPQETLQRYQEARAKGTVHIKEGDAYIPWPQDLFSYLERELSKEYELVYSALNEVHFDTKYNENTDFVLMKFAPENGRAIVKSLIKVSCLNAQRHLADVNSHARAEDLSKCLSRFYKRNLEKQDDDHAALRALYSSERKLNEHLANVFSDTLGRLSDLGYPGFANPNLVIKSALNPAQIMTQDTKVHYSLDSSSDMTLPDSYNGLGFKNLIYMVVEILDLQARWIEEEEDRALLHLIFIEEPEAHLHAQLQQVFVRKIMSLLEIEEDGVGIFNSQVVITSHSPHILYERGFKPIRYFRRSGQPGLKQASTCVNLSVFYDSTSTDDRSFLEKYLKLTHCDLFFSDAAVLVEGNVERILLPIMIKKCKPRLQSAYISILEVGGAFAHKFKALLEFLGIVTLIVTDIDSVLPPAEGVHPAGDDDANQDEAEDGAAPNAGSACVVTTKGALTSNYMLKNWLPAKMSISDLLVATVEERTQQPNADSISTVHVVYQNHQNAVWDGTTTQAVGRTLEESFGLENAEWCQNPTNRALGLRLKPRPASIGELAEKLHKRVNGRAFDKTNFALNVLASDESQWNVPGYIAEGLEWLDGQINLEVQDEAIAATNDLREEVAP